MLEPPVEPEDDVDGADGAAVVDSEDAGAADGAESPEPLVEGTVEEEPERLSVR